MVGIHENILGHVPGSKHPFFLIRQTIGMYGVILSELVAIRFGVLD